MGRKKKQKGYMIIKDDSEKAYEFLNWGFIEEVLDINGSLKDFSNNVVITPSMQLLWNEATTCQFFAS